MTQPPPDIHVDPPAIRWHAQRMSDEGMELEALTNEVMAATDLWEHEPSGQTDELTQAFRQDYEARAPRVEERARTVSHTFTNLGATATSIVDAYEHVDAGTATNVARERGLLPPR